MMTIESSGGSDPCAPIPLGGSVFVPSPAHPAQILKSKFDLPVIYLTAHADDATIQGAKLTGPHGYLLKPVKSGELHITIEVSLFRHNMERQQREQIVRADEFF
jgi:AmiR/NasT family two-component response regulator